MREELRIPPKSLPVPRGGRYEWSSQPLRSTGKGVLQCGLRYSRVVQLRPRDAFFLLTFYFSFDTIITELIEKQPRECLCSRSDQLTIGRVDAPTLPPSGLWSSEEGWAD